MSHPDQGQLHALLDGEVPAAEAARIQAHLEQCTACRQELEQAREFRAEALALVELLDAEPAPATGPGARPRTAPPPQRARTPLPRAQALAWAASLLLAASAGYFASGLLNRPSTALPRSVGPASPLEVAARDEGPDTRSEMERRTEAAKLEADPAPGASQPATAAAGRRRSVTPRPEALRPQDAAAKPAATRPAADAVPAPPVKAMEQAVQEPVRRAEAQPAEPRANQRAPAAAPTVANLGAATRARLDQVADSAGFRLRLVSGLRIQDVVVVDSVIRTTYGTPWGPLVVEQWQTAGRLQVRLVPSPGSPPDSVAVWTARATRDP